MPDDDLPDVAGRLWDVLRETNKCIGWVGAGLSVPPYQGWDVTVERLCGACGVTPLPRGAQAEELIDKAEECKQADVEQYENLLAGSFGPPVVGKRHAYDLLMQLPFKGYISTNFDPLLFTAASSAGVEHRYAYPDLPVEPLGAPGQSAFCVHGVAQDKDGHRSGKHLVLARSEFLEAYDGIVDDFLVQVLTRHPVIFLGARVREASWDETIRRVYAVQKRILKASRKSEAALPKRAILLPRTLADISPASSQPGANIATGSQDSEEDARLEELGIEVLRYVPDDQHSQVEEILELVGVLAGRAKTPAFGGNFSLGGAE